MASLVNSATATAGCTWDYQNTVTGLSNSQQQGSFSSKITYVNGANTSALACDLLYVTTGTIAASGSLNVDLAGALNDFFGTVITMARVKAIYVAWTAATTATSVLLGNGTNPFINWITPSTGAIRIRNGGFFELACQDTTGYAVTAGTGDILKLLNEDGVNTGTYNLAVVGASA